MIIFYYKNISSSEHNPRPLEMEVKCDQNICYRTTVHARRKYFTFLPFEGTFEMSYLSCFSVLFTKSVNHPLLRLKNVGHCKRPDELKESHLPDTDETWLKPGTPSDGPSRSLPDLT